jgi:predicted transcriptional regulator
MGGIMISLKEVIEKLNVEPLTSNRSLDRQVISGYASDLLSCVIKGAKKEAIWVTLQSHLNVVAVASLLNLAGVIITEGVRPDQETLSKAENEGVVLMTTHKTTFTVVGELTSMGIKGEVAG